MKYLFLCTEGNCRSPTAAKVTQRLAASRGLDIDVFYGGVKRLAEPNNPLRAIVENSDRIFVMEDEIRRELLDTYHVMSDKISCLDIPDVYDLDDPDLVALLEERLSPLILP